ncbi:MAG: hypothetical protein IK008_07250 [Bacteroidales bacterium]|nr:hypothetical protein [Bacteroidales bacterium]
MKRFSSLLTALAVAALMLPATVSCNKGDDNALGKGSYSVTDADGNILDESSLAWGGFYFADYGENAQSYDIVLTENDYFNAPEKGWALVDIDKKFCGEEQDLTQDLDGYYDLFLYTRGKNFRSGDFASGTLLVSVDEEKSTVTIKVDGIDKDGNHLKINWSGKVIRSLMYLYNW